MAVYKNRAGQKLAVFAVDSSGAAKTGDAANITAYISKDGGAAAATNDVNPTELDATNAEGVYLFDLTQAETNADLIVLAPKSATSGVTLRPVIVYTEPEIRSADVTYWNGSAAPAMTGDAYAVVNDGTHGNAALKTILDAIDDYVDTEVAAIKAKTDQLTFTGADVHATLDGESVTVGANNDKTGYTLISGPLDAAGVRTAIGMAAANMDAQLAAIVADTGELQTDWTNGGRLDLLIDGLIADLVKVKAAVYDSASVTGNVITLSNGATQTIGADGDRTTS